MVRDALGLCAHNVFANFLNPPGAGYGAVLEHLGAQILSHRAIVAFTVISARMLGGEPFRR